MVTYKYRAQDENGKMIFGTMQATDELDLPARLKQENKYLIQAKAQIEKNGMRRLKSNVVSDFAKNIGELFNRKNYYFVPMIQDDCLKKPASLVSEFSLLPKAIYSALKGIQLRPIIYHKSD